MSMHLEKITHWLLGAVLFLVPLVFWQGVFFPHVFTKVIVFRVLIECAVASWVGLLYLRPEYRPHFGWVLWSVVVWMGVLLLSMIFGVNAYKSWWSDFERMTGVFTQLHLLFFVIMLASIMRQRSDWVWCFRISAISATLVALYGFIEAMQAGGRIIATIGNASFLATYLLGALCVVGWLFIDSWGQKRRSHAVLSMYGAAGILYGVGLMLSGSRGALLGLAAGVVFACAWIWWFFRGLGDQDKARYTLLRRVALGVLVCVVVSGSFVLFAPDLVRRVAPTSLQRIVSIDTGQRTASARLLTWQVAWQGWQERLLLGWGPENFNVLFDRHYNAYLYEQEPWFDRAHNVLFDIGSTSGIFGLGAYLSMFLASWAVLIRSTRRRPEMFLETAVIAFFFMAYLVQNLFTFDVLTSVIFLYLFMAYLVVQEPPLLNSPTHIPSQKTYPVWLGVASVVVLVGVLYGASVRPFLASAAGHAGWEELRNLGSDQKAIRYFDQAIAYGTYGNTNLRRFPADYVFEFIKQGGKRSDESMRTLFVYAMRRMDENIVADPQNVKWPMYAGQLANLYAVRFRDVSFAAKAEGYYLAAQQLSPARPQIYVELAQARKVQGNISGMWEILDAGIKMLPEYTVFYLNEAAHAIDLHDAAREEAAVSRILKDSKDYNGIRDIYFQAGRYDRAIHFQKLYIDAVDPTTGKMEIADRTAQLAGMYVLIGDKEQARISAQKVLEYDPSPKRRSEVEAFLKLLDVKK